MSVRIVVCLDVDVDDKPPEDRVRTAYRRVFRAMRRLEAGDPWIEWESSDEWYGEDGGPIPLEMVEGTRLAVVRDEGEGR